ncbi:amidase family protein [Desulfobotulus sp. H1]|uniref:Amidase family protein n=1 Tax=Desulfobotulus pelophilus TaxID=2823377 RepID=A0ABT3N6T1_9BACT|nr:amidase family protein [Desulfobotulus pelophilus]MCW7753149.1 amidase family protein [Desulfobotulus pelophilus]
MKEYAAYDGMGLADLIRKGDVSRAEVLEAALARAERLNPRLNVIVHMFKERARQMVQEGPHNGPFSGVPFLLKDLMDNFAGEPISMGSRAVREIPADHSELVSRYLATGVIPFGKTSTPEFGLTITTEPKAFGPAHNPWKEGFSTGGSSGGSAAAVAAGIVPMASANDGGGSIRFPAACCGVVGFKPSRGLTPVGPEFGEPWEGAVSGHVITRSVRDSAAMLDAVSGPETGAAYRVSRLDRSCLAACEEVPGSLRIAVSSRPMVKTGVDEEARKGLSKTVHLLQSMGHCVDEADPAVDRSRFWKDYLTVVCGHTAALVYRVKQKGGMVAVRKLEPATRNMAALGRSLSAMDFVRAKEGWHSVQLEMGRFFEKWDVLLTPSLIGPPARHGVIPPSAVEEALLVAGSWLPGSRVLLQSGLARFFAAPTLSRMAFTICGNITGQPGISLPLHWTDEGLPLGMLFTAAMGRDATLFSLAGQLERAAPWADRRPRL